MLEDKKQEISKMLSKNWDIIKRDKITSLQAAKASATQSMKQGFLSKNFFNKLKIVKVQAYMKKINCYQHWIIPSV